MPIINQIVKGGGGSAPAHYVEKGVSSGTLVNNAASFIDLTGVTDLGGFALAYAYYGNMNINPNVNMSSLTQISGRYALFYTFAHSGITSLDMSNVTQITGSNACENMCAECSLLTSVDLGSLGDITGLSASFQDCSNLTSVDLSGATAISGADSTFYGCTGLTSIDLHNVTIIYYANQMFYSCTSLATADVSGVEEITNNAANSMFVGCTSLTTMTWTSLNKLWAQALYDAYFGSGIQTLYFPALTTFGDDVDPVNNPDSDPFYYMLEGVDGCTVHFPAALQATIGNWPSVQSGFEGTNTTVLFDL